MLFEDAGTQAHSSFTTETCRADLQLRNQKKSFKSDSSFWLGWLRNVSVGISSQSHIFEWSCRLRMELHHAFEKPALVFIHEERRRFCVMHGRRNSRQELFFVLTDPMPESATESLPECVVCVLLLGFESVFTVLPPTGQSILAEIWFVTVFFWADPGSAWVDSVNGGVTVMLGIGLSTSLNTGLSTSSKLLGVDGTE